MTERNYCFENISYGKEIVGLLVGIYLNVHTYGHNDFISAMAEEKTVVQYNFTLLCIEWLIELSKCSYFDDRNEVSHRIGTQMAMSNKFTGFTHRPMKRETALPNITVDINNGRAVENAVRIYLTNAYCKDSDMTRHNDFMAAMRNEHKTLLQNFTRLSFNWFRYLAEHNPDSGAAHVKLAKLALQYHRPLPYI